MHLKTRTVVLVALGLTLVATLLFVSFRPDPVPVDLYTVDRGPLQITIDADGRTQIKEIYDVASPITGTALRSPVSVGDRVTAGETVVAIVEPIAPSLLDSRSRSQAEAAVKEAEASVSVAETDLRKALEDQSFAQTQLARVKTLADRGVASSTQLDDARQAAAIATAATDAARARIDLAQGTLTRVKAALIEPEANQPVDLNCCVQLIAPADGVVLSVPVISERPVTAGMPLLSIGDPADLELVGDLLSSDAVRLDVGASAIVERWGGDSPLAAQLARVEPAARTKMSALGIEEQRVDAIFDLTSPVKDRAGLGDGFSVFLRIIEWETQDALRVPLSALFRQGDVWSVYLDVDGIARPQEVLVGHRSSGLGEVLEGLVEGDRVITHPSDDVTDGARLMERSPG